MEYVQLGRLGVRVSRICLGVAFRGQPDDGIAAQRGKGSGGAQQRQLAAQPVGAEADRQLRRLFQAFVGHGNPA